MSLSVWGKRRVNEAPDFRVAMILEEGKLGGPQIYVERLAAASAEFVHTTVIIPNENSSLFQELLNQSNLEFVAFDITRITKEIKVAVRYVLFSWLEILRLYKYFNKNRFDCIYVAGGAWQYKGLIAGKLSRHKVIWHQNDTQSPRIFRLVFSFLSRFADFYVYASKKTQDYYRPLVRGALKSDSHAVIPSPVDTKYFSPDVVSLSQEVFPSYWLGKKVIGVVANINPVKGLESYIAVAANLNKRIPNLLFVVVGPINDNQKKYHEELIRLCEQLEVQNIEFVGARKDVRPLLQKMDMYLCTSVAESSPIAVWEALSMGLPVVSTDVGDVSEYVVNGVNGYVVPVGDVDCLADRSYTLLNRPVFARQCGESARKAAVQKLDISCCVEKHLAVYRTL